MFLLFLIISSIGLINCNEFTYSDCSTADPHIRINDVSLESHPIRYPKLVILNISMDILKEIDGENAKVKFVAKKLKPIVIPIPCVGKYGSCTYRYCDYWNEFKNEETPENNYPDCPLTPGNYFYKNGKIYLPNETIIYWIFPIMMGDYSADMIFFNDQTKQVYGCTRVNFTILMDSSKKKPKLQ